VLTKKVLLFWLQGRLTESSKVNDYRLEDWGSILEKEVYFIFIATSRLLLVATSARIESMLELSVNKKFIELITSI
jgi:hypothetical protein